MSRRHGFWPADELHLVNDPLRSADLLGDPQDEPDIDRDRTIAVRVVVEVVPEALVVPVEDEPDLFAVSVQHWRSAIAADDVVRRDEIDDHVSILTVAAEVFRCIKILDLLRHVKRVDSGVFFEQ